MIDLANVFYVLGIIFFLTCFIFVVLAIGFIVSLYSRINKIKTEFPVKVISYLKSNNTTQLKALGVAIVGYILSFLRGKVQERKKATK
ncbi:hypothetical protein KBB12_03805 [Candidatus Woesebacteria bacterium]|nr:hypothetical protein [Candidatus Woesebacteria bacterium]